MRRSQPRFPPYRYACDRGFGRTTVPGMETSLKGLDKRNGMAQEYEAGERRLHLFELRVVCDALGVSLLGVVRRFERS